MQRDGLLRPQVAQAPRPIALRDRSRLRQGYGGQGVWHRPLAEDNRLRCAGGRCCSLLSVRQFGPRMGQGREQRLVQALIAQPPVKAFIGTCIFRR